MWKEIDNKNWTKITRKILRFGELSRYQREVEGIGGLSHTKVYLKCEGCDAELASNKLSERNREHRWNLENWKPVIRKAQVKKDDGGYYIKTRIEFYCPDCQR